MLRRRSLKQRINLISKLQLCQPYFVAHAELCPLPSAATCAFIRCPYPTMSALFRQPYPISSALLLRSFPICSSHFAAHAKLCAPHFSTHAHELLKHEVWFPATIIMIQSSLHSLAPFKASQVGQSSGFAQMLR